MALHVKMEIGQKFNAYKRDALARKERYYVKDFCEIILKRKVNRQLRKRVADYGLLASKLSETWMGTNEGNARAAKLHRVTKHVRKNIPSTQGRPTKSPSVREALWQWFVDIRGILFLVLCFL